MNLKAKNIIGLLIGIIAGILITVAMIGITADAKMVCEYKGKYIASSYTAASNTPAGSHQTWSGHRATEGVTVAVDDRTPIAPIGAKIMLKWRVGKKWHSHVYRVHDKGHFGHMNGGRRQLDVFFEHRGWGLRWVKVYVYRKETPKERKARIRRKMERARKLKLARQKEEFEFVFDHHLLPWQVVTDKKIISGGAVRVGFMWLDVVGHKKGLGNKVLCGDRLCWFGGKFATFKEIREEAVG